MGSDPEQALVQLLRNCDFDIEKAQKGIVYFDEFDKLSRKGENVSITRDVSGEGVQTAILKMVEGAIVDVPPDGGRKYPGQKCIQLDTSNILFIIGGSFEGIEKIIAKRLKKDNNQIGFNAKIESKENIEVNKYIEHVETDDLKKFGIIPEVLGRFPVIVPLKELDTEALINILTKPKNAIIKQYQELFLMDGIKLTFDNDSLVEIAKLAQAKKTGARALRGIVEKVLHKYMYSFPDDSSIKEVIITKDVIINGKEPVIKKKRKIS